MPESIYRLTNKVTFSRAIVVARSADEARKAHPTNDLATWRDDVRGAGWYTYRSGGATGGMHGFVPVPTPRGWTADLGLIHVDLLADCGPRSPCSGGAEAYQPSEELRHKGEGPDDSWGGRSLRELGGVYADYADGDLGPLFSSVVE